jgi:hypothetical protein
MISAQNKNRDRVVFVGGPADSQSVFLSRPVSYARLPDPDLKLFHLYRLRREPTGKIYRYLGTFPNTRIQHMKVSLKEDCIEKLVWALSGLLTGLVIGKCLNALL